MNKFVCISKLAANSFPSDRIVFDTKDSNQTIRWNTLLEHIFGYIDAVRDHGASKWILRTEDPLRFLCGFVALTRAAQEIHIVHSQKENEASEFQDFGIFDDTLEAKVSENAKTRDLDPLDPRRLNIVFHTSGSTGMPKLVYKTLLHIERELENLNSMWGAEFAGRRILTTVSHSHFYGFLFSMTLPFCAGGVLSQSPVTYPETLAADLSSEDILISSPAFYKRLQAADLPGSESSPVMAVSSGGFLPAATAEYVCGFLKTPVTEIYGSTETGGIGYRSSPSSSSWNLFPGMKLETGHNGEVSLFSPYVPLEQGYILEDQLDIAEDGTFTLLGRKDSVVKIEEKRIALNDVENRILETGLAEDCAVIAFTAGRQYLGAAVVLNDAGREKFKESPKKELNAFFRKSLAEYFEPVVIPRKWRFPGSLHRNPQGKVRKESIADLFKKSIQEPELIEVEKNAERVVLKLRFDSRYIHFSGHFPQMKLLPAVAQIDWVMKYTRRYFAVETMKIRMPRIKFTRPIFPDTDVLLSLKWNRESASVQFSFTSCRDHSDAPGDVLYSKGKIQLTEETQS